MIIRFYTPRDINGNTLSLVVDFDSQCYAKGYGMSPEDINIKVSKTTLHEIQNALDNENFDKE